MKGDDPSIWIICIHARHVINRRLRQLDMHVIRNCRSISGPPLLELSFSRNAVQISPNLFLYTWEPPQIYKGTWELGKSGQAWSSPVHPPTQAHLASNARGLAPSQPSAHPSLARSL
ncbi:hypothetical protein GBA52_020280 [Prunus armeniaca]|nr:hypothetical protein GBA52_020280 [Prunus armeniaca]